MAQLHIPLCTVLPQVRSPSRTAFLIKGRRHSTCLSLKSVLQFPASPWNYPNKPITSSHRNQGSPNLITTKAATRPACLFTLLRSAAFLCSVWRSVLPQAVSV